MKRKLLAGAAGLSCLALLAIALPAWAMMIAPAPPAQRLATADVVVVGKVIGFADKAVSALPNPDTKDKVEYQVAIVRVEQSLLGAKDVKEVRVGFLPPPPPPPPPAPGGPFILRKPYRMPTLALDQEALLFLTKHADADFYVMPAYFSIVEKKNPGFANDLAEVKKAAALLADPKAGLESKNADERMLTAALLISRYRTAPPGSSKTEPIDAAQSKLILQTLADADWKAGPGPGGLRNQMMGPQAMFFRLGLTPKDGWTQPKDFNTFPAAAKKWLKENADTYRIERFVSAEKAEKNDK